MGSTLLTPFYVVYRDLFGFSELTLTVVYAVYAVGNLAALFLLGRLSDELGRKRIALPALGLAAIATLVFLFAAGIGWLFVGRTLTGLANGLAAAATTAWIAELSDARDKSEASTIATTFNFAGIALGPLLAGLLIQYAPAPLHLAYVVYLMLLAIVAAFVARTRETVRQRPRDQPASLRPRIGVPREIRARFVSPAMTAFASFSLGGFYSALTPSLLAREMHEPNLAIGGAAVFELFIVAACAVVATRPLASRTAMLGSAALLIPSAGLLVLAELDRSMPVLVVGLAVSGVAIAMGYRGTLQVVNEIAPGDRRAEVIASYQIACFLGNSLPVVGVGVVSMLTTPVVATAALALVIALLALVALATEMRFGGVQVRR